MATSWTWTDGWLLMALIPAAKNGAADLVDLLDAADCLNHAMPSEDELNESLTRLRQHGVLTSESSPFAPDPVLYDEIHVVIGKTSGLFNLPDAGRKWLTRKNLPRTSDAEVRITSEEFMAAYKAYVRKVQRR